MTFIILYMADKYSCQKQESNFNDNKERKLIWGIIESWREFLGWSQFRPIQTPTALDNTDIQPSFYNSISGGCFIFLIIFTSQHCASVKAK